MYELFPEEWIRRAVMNCSCPICIEIDTKMKVDKEFCGIFDVSFEIKEYMPLFNLAKEMDN